MCTVLYSRSFFFLIFFITVLLLCHLFSVFFFPSVDKSPTSLFFHLTELEIHPIRIGYVQSERGEEGFFLPTDKKKKTQERGREKKRRFRMRYRSVLSLRIILETIMSVPWFSDSSSSRRNLNSFSLYTIDRNRYSSHSSFSSAPKRRRRRMEKRQKAWAVVEMAESPGIFFPSPS